jgi:capsular exopolysaccharide synthesis family protein
MVSTENGPVIRDLSEDAQATPYVDETSLLDVWAIVWRRKWLIAFGLAAGIALGYLQYFQATPIYKSKVEILVVPKDADLPTSRSYVENDFGQKSLEEDVLSTQMQIFKSPRIVAQAVEKNNLQSLPAFAGGSAVKSIVRELEVTKGGEGKAKDAKVLCASFQSPYPEDCPIVLNAVVESYQDFLGETFRNTSSEAVELITKAKSEVGEELREREAEYQEFRKNAPLIWKGEESLNVHQDRLAKIEESLSEITQKWTEAKARLGVIEEALRGTDPQDLSDVEKLALLGEAGTSRLDLVVDVTEQEADSPAATAQVQTQYQRLLELLLQEATLMEDYGDDHPELQSVRQQIKLTKEYIGGDSRDEELGKPRKLEPGELLAAHMGLLRHDVDELEKRQRDLQELARQESQAARGLVVYELRDETMRNEIARKTELYEAVVDRLREINLIKDYGGYLTEVLAPAERPTSPVSPNPILSLGFGAALGLFFGAGLAWLVDLSDRTFRNPDEVCHSLDLPIMAHVPLIRTPKRHRFASSNGDGPSQVDSSVVAYHRATGEQAESFRGLRSSILYGATCADRKVIQVTSPLMQDGKTTVAANLAVALARSRRRVLLVDADMRRPRAASLFGIKTEVGLPSVLTDEVEPPDAICSTEIENLWVLPCGSRPDNPSELLTLPKFEEMLEALRQQYDYLVIDSPPVLAVSDPSVIAPRVDGVLLTIRITKNGSPMAIRSKDILTSLGVDLLGVVVNRTGHERGNKYGYYGGQYGGYGRGNGYGYGCYGYGEEDSNGCKDTKEHASTPIAHRESRRS